MMERPRKNHNPIIPFRQHMLLLEKSPPLTLTDRPFVHFCHKITDNSDFEQALERLRCQQGFNPNMILYICWLSLNQHGRNRPAEIKQLLEQIYYWHESVIRPLTYIIEDLQKKNGFTAQQLLRQVKTEWCQADIVEKCLLADIQFSRTYLLRSFEQRLQDICCGIASYARLLSAKLMPTDLTLLMKIFQTVLPELSPKVITKITQDKLQKVSTMVSGDGFAQWPLTLAI